MIFNPIKSISANDDKGGIELYSNQRMIVTDCKCVVDYSDECIVVNIGKLNVKVRGCDLIVSSFAFGQTDITGNIISVEFEKA